ncbi:MAG: bifunctional riboflavin kinase/FAD synthetase [Gammaproteobacteria bacterium]|nr:bifunctional riboflavin kinase/FAD synthetase [Gammaproteobacteria bacterium]
MQLIRGLESITKQLQPCVATIGKFDGIHIGHQQIINEVIRLAKLQNRESAVIVFEPDPQEFFAGENAPARLTRFREKWRIFKQLGVEKVICLKFSEALASMKAEHFIDDLLVEKLAVKHLIVGDDFRFGVKRSGDYALLQQHGAGKFEVQNTASITHGVDRVSSTLVRQYLANGKFDLAEKLLGRRYSIEGKVAHGDKLGRTINFPTLNLALKRKVSPLQGVFLVKVFGLANECFWGVANIGRRPTVKGNINRLEVHVFDFEKDCYGKEVTVEFVRKIRDEKKFDSVEFLKQQIAIDVDNAKRKIELLN